MNENQILELIHRLVTEEHGLRDKWTSGHGLTRDEQARLDRLEEQLDQCWDLLRQRRALIDAGLDPDEAHVRPPWEVEAYLQ